MRNATYMSKRGFTLIEILTTIAIIGILVGITSMVYSSSLKRSRDGQRKTDLDSIKNALEQYYLDNRNYPPYQRPDNKERVYNARWQFESGLVSRCASPATNATLTPLILPTIPEDPLNKLPDQVSNCEDLIEGNLSGEYIYFVGGNTEPRSNDRKPKAGYYLLAKMETAPNVNINNSNDCTNTSSSRYIQSFIGNGNSCGISNISWDYDIQGLVINNGIGSSTTHNYFVSSKPNN